MPDSEPLRRLGGGRWQTRDGRFTIEPQAGTWMIVDAERTDDLGLPRVRGPYRSLGAARSAIDSAREEGAHESPLAGLVKAAKSKPRASRRAGSRAARRDSTPSDEADEPAWLDRLDEPRRRQARDLLGRLEQAGVSDPEAIARAEIIDDQPALARMAIEQRLRDVVASTDEVESLVPALLDVVTRGGDDPSGLRWRLVDGEGRTITALSVRRDDMKG